MTESRESGANIYPRDSVTLRELGLRDGLQMTRNWPATNAKLEWLELSYAAGVRHFEVGSFLPARKFPQFADVAGLIARVGEMPGAVSSALALNERGIEDALCTPVDEIVIPVSCTEEHSQANMRRSRSSAIGLVQEAVAGSSRKDRRPAVSAATAVAFGCSIAGEVKPEEVLRVLGKCAEAGAHSLAIADTVGFAGPAQVTQLCKLLIREFGDYPLKIHLHDTRGTAIANAYAALDSGIRILDGTIGGLGGCPFAPGATGNVVFEDLVYLCERCGYDTGIDLDRLVKVRSILEREMPGEPLHGTLANAGIPPLIRWAAGP